MQIKGLHHYYKSLINKNINISGWITTARSQKDFTFIKINDGTHPLGVQVIVNSEDKTRYKTGMSVNVDGKLVESPAEGQLFEIQANEITVIGDCMDDYPLAKSKMSLDYLRTVAHLRGRTSTFGSVFRIKSAISIATHKFFEEKGFLHLDPNIMTVNECEGGAGVFQVTEKDISKPKNLELVKEEYIDETGKKQKRTTDLYDWSKDHFGKPVYLTVSSQLQLEALACALGNVYTMNKSFRSEHSSTTKHLSEFTHLEIESCFISLNELMNIAEEYIKYVGNYILEKYREDIDNLDKFVSKGIKDRITTIVNSIFERITYTEAIKIAQEKGKKITFGEDLSSEVEQCLTEHFNKAVFVYNWPISVKSFYMKQDDTDNSICHNFDLLMPYKIGEMIGGSMREDNYDKLIKMMKMKGVSEEPLKFYTDLRKYGTVPHGGFGLGFDRMTMLFTGMENIRDTIPFPVAYKSCDY
jgi:asparaginyl-tRNA synthetase